ncbi:hypothetical protein LINPERHAP2_LOCUS33402 [Linum perenne]
MTVLHHSGKLGLPLMNLVRFQGMPILEQLQLEEKLLRKSIDNWCIVNDGTNSPAIVMGVYPAYLSSYNLNLTRYDVGITDDDDEDELECLTKNPTNPVAKNPIPSRSRRRGDGEESALSPTIVVMKILKGY